MKIRDFNALRFDVSQKPYDFSTSQGMRLLRANVDSFLRHLGVKTRRVYFMKQIHSDHIACLDDGPEMYDYYGYKILPATDALITARKNLALVSRISDCTPVLLYDPVRNVQACIHSGWRPTVKKLPAKALAMMQHRYGTRPQDVFAYIGPCIGRRSFQVGKEVSVAWREAFSFADSVIYRDDAEHDHIDLKMTHIRMLLQAGIPEEHITVNARDTFTDPRYHSYRRDRPHYGSNALISVLR